MQQKNRRRGVFVQERVTESLQEVFPLFRSEKFGQRLARLEDGKRVLIQREQNTVGLDAPRYVDSLAILGS